MSEHSTQHSGAAALAAVRAGTLAALPKRFYAEASVAQLNDGFAVLLDGRAMKTPGRLAVILPRLALAQAVAAEWARQGENINPATMPLTRLSNSAVEGVAQTMQAVTDEVVRYAGSDLVCYRASEPPGLVQVQADAWDAVLEFAQTYLKARFVRTTSILHVAQPPATLAACAVSVARWVGQDAAAPFRLAALSTITSLTGSALLALQCAVGATSAAQAWAAAHVDEDFQAREWGTDFEAQARRASRWLEMAAAAEMLEFCAAA